MSLWEGNFELNVRARWIIWWRVVFLVVMATSAWTISYVFKESLRPELFSVFIFGLSVSLFSGIAIFYAQKKNKRSWIKSIAWLQLPVDALITAFLVSQTGGLYSAFILLYGLQIILGAILFHVRGAEIATAFSFLSFIASLVVLESGVTQWNQNAWLRLFFVTASISVVGLLIRKLFRHRAQILHSLEEKSEELKSIHQIHSAIVSEIPIGLILLHSSRKFLFFNQAAQKILGKNLVSSTWDDLQLPIDLSQGDGEVNWMGQIIKFRVAPVGEQHLVVLEDVSSVRLLEEENEAKKRLATVGQFAAGLAHEIKNPLASLSGSIQMLKDELSLSERDDRLMQIILRETDRLDRLLENFLSYARPSELQFDKKDLSRIAQEVFDLVKQDAEVATGSLQFSFEAHSEAFCECDENQIRQVIWNLLRNAFRAVGERGKVSLRVFPKFRGGEPWLRLEVEDNGTGMSEEVANRIFEPFYSFKQQGSGLGLALVFQIVEAHHGIVGVQSEERKGSLFWLEIPCRKKSKEFLNKTKAA